MTLSVLMYMIMEQNTGQYTGASSNCVLPLTNEYRIYCSHIPAHMCNGGSLGHIKL